MIQSTTITLKPSDIFKAVSMYLESKGIEANSVANFSLHPHGENNKDSIVVRLMDREVTDGF